MDLITRTQSFHEGGQLRLEFTVFPVLETDTAVNLDVPSRLYADFGLSAELETIVIPAGEYRYFAYFDIPDNSISQPARSEYTVSLSDDQNGVTAGPRSTYTFGIEDNDPAILSLPDSSVREDAGTLSVPVTLSNIATRTVVASFRPVAVTTSLEPHFEDQLYTAVFPAGTQSTSLNLPIIDRPEDGPGSFRLELVGIESNGINVSFEEQFVTQSSVRLAGEPGALTITPDSSAVIYNREYEGVNQTVSVPIAGGKITTIGPGHKFIVDPQGGRIAFSEDARITVADIDGTNAVIAEVPFRQSQQLQFSPDGRYLAFIGSNYAERLQLWLADTKTGESRQLVDDPDLDLYFNTTFQFTPDSQGIVFAAERSRFRQLELMHVDLYSGRYVRLNTPQHELASVRDFQVSPTGEYVVYLEDAALDEVVHLHSVDLSDGKSIQLSGALPDEGDIDEFKISDDGLRVVYMGDQEREYVTEIYSVDIGGGPVRKLNPGASMPGEVLDFQIAPHSQSVVYRSTHNSGVGDLFSVPILAGASRQLNPASAFGQQVEANYQITADGRRVVYYSQQDAKDRYELFSASIDDGSSVRLNARTDSGQMVWADFQLSADGQQVFYRSNTAQTGVDELYAVSVTGGSPRRLNQPLTSAGDVLRDFLPSPDSSHIVYRAAVETGGVYSTFAVPTRSGAPVSIDTPGRVAARADSITQTSDGEHLILRGALAAGESTQIFRVPTQGGPPERIHEDLGPDNYVRWLKLSADGRWVLFAVRNRGNNSMRLHSVPSTGGQSIRLRPDVSDSAPLPETQIDPSSTWVLMETSSMLQIRRIDGTGPLQTISDNFLRRDARFAADGSAVYFRSQESASGPVHIHRWDTSSGTSSRITTAEPASRRELDYLVAEDHSVFYRSEPVEQTSPAIFRFLPETQETTEVWRLPDNAWVNRMYALTEKNRLLIDWNSPTSRQLTAVNLTDLSTQLLTDDLPRFTDARVKISPDQQWVAYRNSTSSVSSAVVLPTDGRGTAWTFSQFGQKFFEFTPDSSHLLLIVRPWESPTEVSTITLTDGTSKTLEIEDHVDLSRGSSFEFVNDGRHARIRGSDLIYSWSENTAFVRPVSFVVPRSDGRSPNLNMSQNSRPDGIFTGSRIVPSAVITVLDTVPHARFGETASESTAEWALIRDTDATEIYLEAVDRPRIALERHIQTGNKFQLNADYPLGRYRLWVRGLADGQPVTAWAATILQQHIAPHVQTSVEGTTLTASWEPVNGATSYRIYVQHLRSSAVPVIDRITTQTSVPIDVSEFGKYRLWVQAISNDGSRKWSSSVNYSATVHLTSHGNSFATRPVFRWTAFPDADSYEIYLLRDGQLLINTRVSVPSYQYTTQLEQGRFRWWVRPISVTGETGPWSAADEFHTGGRTVIRPMPANSDQVPLIRWEAVDAAAGYEVWVWNIRTRETPYRVTGLTETQFQPGFLEDSDYRVWVRAHHSNGTPGQWSPPVDFKLDAVSTLHQAWPDTAAQGSFSQTPELTWQGNAAAVEYEVFLYDGQYQYHTTTQTHFTLPAGLNGSTIRWGVRVRDASGQAGPWAEAVIRLDANVINLTGLQTASARPAHFTWDPVQGAVAYELLVQTTQGEFLRDRTISQPEFTAPERFAAGSYRVWVRAIGGGNTIGPWSQRYDFIVS